jgi:hypothetical protein
VNVALGRVALVEQKLGMEPPAARGWEFEREDDR